MIMMYLKEFKILMHELMSGVQSKDVVIKIIVYQKYKRWMINWWEIIEMLS